MQAGTSLFPCMSSEVAVTCPPIFPLPKTDDIFANAKGPEYNVQK